MNNMGRYISQMAMLTAAAVILGFVESLLPPPVPVPGIKLGLGNLAVILALYCINARSAFLLALLKAGLCALLFAGFSGFLYSAAGAVVSFAAMYALKKTNLFSVIGVSSAGGMFHNIGQLAAAYFIVGKAVVYYIPVLTASGAVTGIITGSAAAVIIRKGEIIFGKK